MKYDFNLPDIYNNKKLILCLEEDPSAIAYLNIFEEGDIWIKKKGCKDCPTKSREQCCKNCSKYRIDGCEHHLDDSNGQEKPFICVIAPTPKSRIPYCQIEFECVKGKEKGTIIKINREAKNK